MEDCMSEINNILDTMDFPEIVNMNEYNQKNPPAIFVPIKDFNYI